MNLLKLNKKELKAIASTSDAWQVRDRMAEMLAGIKEIKTAVNSNGDRLTQLPQRRQVGRDLNCVYLEFTYKNSGGETVKTSIQKQVNTPLAIGHHVGEVALIARLALDVIGVANEEGYFINKKLIKKLNKVVYLGREYLKAYKEAYSGEPPTWVDESIVALKWTPNANLRVLAMLKAAKKMEKALEGIKEHLKIEPFEEVMIDGKKTLSISFGRLSDDIELVSLGGEVKMISNLILNPITIYLKEECPDLPEKDKRRILQSRVAVLALIQIRPPQTEAFEAVNQAVLAVMMA